MDFGSPFRPQYSNIVAENTPRGSVSHFLDPTSYESLNLSGFTGFCASKLEYLTCEFRAKRLYGVQVMTFSVRKPSRLGLLRKSLIPLVLFTYLFAFEGNFEGNVEGNLKGNFGW